MGMGVIDRHFPRHSSRQTQLSSGSGSHHLVPGRSPRSNPTFEKGKTERTRRDMTVSKQDKVIKYLTEFLSLST